MRCAYHGFTYDQTGSCVFAPGVAGAPKFGVRTYPTKERGSWVWAWMGEDEPDDSVFPLPKAADGKDWHGISGYTRNGCNYLLVHENLLDLTHLHYLHGLATETYAATPPVALTSKNDRAIGHGKDLSGPDAGHPGALFGINEHVLPPSRRVEEIWSIGPSLNYSTQDLYLADGAPAVPSQMLIMHAITPETMNSTHQFWCVQIDSDLVDPPEAAVERTRVTFSEDAEVLAIQNDNIENDQRGGVVENSIPSDVHGVKFRRVLQRLAAAEKVAPRAATTSR